jgi:hypothetical protein
LIAAANAPDTAFAFHAFLGAAASLAAVFAILAVDTAYGSERHV